MKNIKLNDVVKRNDPMASSETAVPIHHFQDKCIQTVLTESETRHIITSKRSLKSDT